MGRLGTLSGLEKKLSGLLITTIERRSEVIAVKMSTEQMQVLAVARCKEPAGTTERGGLRCRMGMQASFCSLT